MTITHTHEEAFKTLAPRAEFYGGVECIGSADDWGRTAYSFRNLRAKGMDKRILIRLFAYSPKIPTDIRRNFACLCASRVLPLYRLEAPDDDLPEHLLRMGWQLARGLDPKHKELARARRASARALIHKRVTQMSAFAALGALHSILAEASYIAASGAAHYAQDARYYAALKNKKGESAAQTFIERERDQQITDIIALTEKRPVVVIRKARTMEVMP